MKAPRIGTPGRASLQVRPHVGLEVDRQPEDLAVPGRPTILDVLDLVPAVDGGLVALAAATRSTSPGGPACEAAPSAMDLLRRDTLSFRAEAAADVRRDDPDLVLRQAGHQRPASAAGCAGSGWSPRPCTRRPRSAARPATPARLHRGRVSRCWMNRRLTTTALGLGRPWPRRSRRRRRATGTTCWCPCRSAPGPRP